MSNERPLSLLPPWGWLLAAVFTTQVFVAAIFPVLPEEAYHWNFGRHLDYGYLDHPPMVPWAIEIGHWVLGDSALGVRLVPLLFALGTTMLLARMARRFYGKQAPFWAVLLHAMQPATFFVGGWGFPDSPVLFFWMLTLTLVWQAVDTKHPALWLAAGAALGAGMLSKYTASFLVPSIFLYLVFSRRDRRWLVTPWPYLAGVCSLVVFTPVLYWNWTHDWASFRMQSTSRFEAANTIGLSYAVTTAGEQWILVLPLTLPLAVIALRRLLQSSEPRDAFLFWAFAPMAAFFFVIGWTPSWHLLWSLPAYMALTVAMSEALTEMAGGVCQFYHNWWAWLTGLEFIGVCCIVLHGLFVLPGIPPLRNVYGWDEVAAQAKTLHMGLPEGSFYMTAGGRPYPSTSQLAYHLCSPFQVFGQNVVGQEALQYRYWSDLKQLAGKDAVVVFDGDPPDDFVDTTLMPYFRSVELVRNLEMPAGQFESWSDRTVRFTLFLAYGYRPAKNK